MIAVRGNFPLTKSGWVNGTRQATAVDISIKFLVDFVLERICFLEKRANI